MFRTRSCLPLLLAAACLAVAAGLLRHDLRQLALLRNTFVLATGTCAISLPLGTVLAFLLVRTDVPGRRLVLALIGGLLMLPLYLQAAGWDAGFGQLGWCSLVRGAAATPLLQGGTAAVWIHALAAVPWVVLLVGAALLGVEPELEEDALLAGSTWQVFRHVTLPRMFGGVAVAAGWVALSVCGEMTVTDLFLVRTYAEELYTGFALGDTLAAAWRAAVPGILVQASLLLVAIASLLRVAPTLATPLRPARPYRLRSPAGQSGRQSGAGGTAVRRRPLAALVAGARGDDDRRQPVRFSARVRLVAGHRRFGSHRGHAGRDGAGVAGAAPCLADVGGPDPGRRRLGGARPADQSGYHLGPGSQPAGDPDVAVRSDHRGAGPGDRDSNLAAGHVGLLVRAGLRGR